MLCAILVFTKCFLFLYHCCILSEIKPTTQCWKFPQVHWSEADNFGGGLGTFCWFFFNFMFMIWDSRHEDLQLFWLSFKHCYYYYYYYISWINCIKMENKYFLYTIHKICLTYFTVNQQKFLYEHKCCGLWCGHLRYRCHFNNSVKKIPIGTCMGCLFLVQNMLMVTAFCTPYHVRLDHVI